MMSCKTAADPLKITVLISKTSLASGGCPPNPPPEAVPPDPRWGLRPQTPL